MLKELREKREKERKRKFPGMFPVIFFFFHMPHRHWDLLGDLCTSWPRIGLFRAATGLSQQNRGGSSHGGDQLCLSSVGGDSAPSRFQAENRAEVATPGSEC